MRYETHHLLSSRVHGCRGKVEAEADPKVFLHRVDGSFLLPILAMPRNPDTSPTGTRTTEIFTISPFPLDRGDVVLPSLVLAYRTYGNQSPDCKTVIVSTCFGEKVRFTC